VAQQTDVQVGGTDQLFNIVVAGRKLQEAMGQKSLVAVITGILPGTDGVQRMSKSTGNVIPLNTTPEDMYGKVMSLPDFAMPIYFKLVTRYTPAQIAEIEKGLAPSGGTRHPRDIKMELAREIVAIYHGEDKVTAAEAHFKSIFQKGGLPEDMETLVIRGEPVIVDFLAEEGLVKSKSEARRLIEQGGLKVDGRTVQDVSARLLFGNEAVVQVGKRKYVKVTRS
jgi:tyrosyl-tRNA synthetase